MSLKQGIVPQLSPVRCVGQVKQVSGPVLHVSLPGAAVGDTVEIQARADYTIPGEVISYRDSSSIVYPAAPPLGIVPGAQVITRGEPWMIHAYPALQGTLLDWRGEIISRAAEPKHQLSAPAKLLPLQTGPDNRPRRPIDSVLKTGVRAVDAFTTLGVGQRIAVFAEPGLGKSTLLAEIANNAEADIKILALIGERSREIEEMTRRCFENRSSSDTIILACAGQEPALCRINAAYAAIRLSEYFSSLGLSVFLMMDSLTRVARALREVGLSAGELPVRQGYPASVFAKMPQLVESAGAFENGAVTSLYTVLRSSDLSDDPMVEEIQGLLDGHIVLSRRLAERGHFPAIDILASLSRLASGLVSPDLNKAARTARAFLSSYLEQRELLEIGGAMPENFGEMEKLNRELETFLRQTADDSATPLESTQATLLALASEAERLCNF